MHSLIKALIQASIPEGIMPVDPKHRESHEQMFTQQAVIHGSKNWQVQLCDCGLHMGIFSRNHDVESPKVWDLQATIGIRHPKEFQSLHVQQLAERYVFDARESMSFHFYVLASITHSLTHAIANVQDELDDDNLVGAVDATDSVKSLAEIVHHEMIGFAHRGTALGSAYIALTEGRLGDNVLESYLRK